MTNSFWEGGADVHYQELDRQHEEQLAGLRDRIDRAASKLEREEIEKEIVVVKQAFRDEVKKIGRLLF